jgi:hypothetical protein
MLMINRITEELLVAAGRRPAGPLPDRPVQDDEGIAEQAKHWAAEAENVIATHPGASLAAALGLGILIGWWVKRT